MRYLALIPIIALSACETPLFEGGLAGPGGTAPAARPATLDPTPPPLPPEGARTIEQFDTTSAEDRAEALAVEASAPASSELGTTIASLGPPAEPGIWLKTPLVSELTPGRVVYQGNSVNVELRPSGGAAGAGSQMSLAAMRLIEAPLTGLPEVTVFTR